MTDGREQMRTVVWWRTQSESNPSPFPKFPANREKNREFHQIGPLCKILKAATRADSKASSEIPYATEQGIISAEQGILVQEQGISPATESLPNDVFGTYRLALVAMLVDAQMRVDIRLLEAAIGDPCVRALDGAVDQRVRPAIAMSSADRSYVRSGFLRVSTRIFAAPRRDNLRQDRDRNLVGGDGAEVEASRRLELGEPFRCNAPLR